MKRTSEAAFETVIEAVLLGEGYTRVDDKRFDRTLCFLAETLSRNHQVFLFSCQTERHLAWRQRHPDLFDARFHLVELPPQ